MIEMNAQASPFEFTANSLCLDFTNTLNDRASGHPRELLNSYGDVVTWSQGAQLLTEYEANRLLNEANRQPEQARIVLHRTIEVREAMFRLFSRVGGRGSTARERSGYIKQCVIGGDGPGAYSSFAGGLSLGLGGQGGCVGPPAVACCALGGRCTDLYSIEQGARLCG